MRTLDAAWIRAVATHPDVWPWISDGAPSHTYRPDIEGAIYLRTGPGFMSFKPWTKGWWDVHIAMPRKSPTALHVALSGLEWMANNAGARGFVARMAARNRAVLALARECGFRECGRIPGCIRGNDMILMERH